MFRKKPVNQDTSPEAAPAAAQSTLQAAAVNEPKSSQTALQERHTLRHIAVYLLTFLILTGSCAILTLDLSYVHLPGQKYTDSADFARQTFFYNQQVSNIVRYLIVNSSSAPSTEASAEDIYRKGIELQNKAGTTPELEDLRSAAESAAQMLDQSNYRYLVVCGDQALSNMPEFSAADWQSARDALLRLPIAISFSLTPNKSRSLTPAGSDTSKSEAMVQRLGSSIHGLTDYSGKLPSFGSYPIQLEHRLLRFEAVDLNFPLSDRFAAGQQRFDQFGRLSWLFLIAVISVALIFLGSWIYLLRNAGKPTLRPSWFDRIPGDLLVFLTFIVVWLLLPNHIEAQFYAGYYLLIAYFIGSILLLSLIRRARAGILVSQNISIFILRHLVRLYRNTRLFVKIGLGWLAVCFSFLLLTGLFWPQTDGHSVLFSLATITLIFVILAIWAAQFDALLRAAAKIGQSGFAVDMPTRHMQANLRALAGELQTLDVKTKQAVDDQMKSERFKTELISNVSHDLRTPLTSIISYVDLLRQQADDPDKREEHLNILEQKAMRLKQLGENLIDAAKASSGAVTVQRVDVRLDELIAQAVGEAEQRFTARDLSLVVQEPRDASGAPLPLVLTSDGQHIWRILDNLLDNASKYALKGSRVYLQSGETPTDVWFRVRNVTQEPLDCSIDELHQRFVRGDRSRHTEGSGLGLAIALSLAELLGGKLNLSIDCDVFTAVVTLPKSR